MPEPDTCRLLMDPPAAGAWNMAVDEALLESVAAGGGCCWRFYRWKEPTLSLGYFQAIDDRRRHPASLPCPVVRRLSGGGAILHDVELTYSFVVAAGHRLAEGRRQLYQTVHATLIEALGELGVPASLAGDSARAGPNENPFLCFQRRAAGDVVSGSVKIAGSAQRRSRRAVLQHGSVLVRRSNAAPELPGLSDALGKKIGCGVLVGLWLEALRDRLELVFAPGSLSPDERARAEVLARTKYGSAQWTLRRQWQRDLPNMA